MLSQMRDGELRLVATSLSFTTALAMIPFLAVVLATFQSIGNLEALYPKVESLLLSNFKVAAGPEATKWIRIILRNIQGQSLGITGAAFLFIASLRLFHGMEMAVHRVWNIPNSRPLYKRIFVYWLLILLIPLGLAIYVGLGSMSQFQMATRLVPAAIADSLLLFGGLFIVNKYVPQHRVAFVPALVGSLISGGGLWLVQKVFKVVGYQVFAYNKIYGSLAALPLILLWILAIWNVILAGVAITASLQKRRILS